jgi:hypothetical protein
MTENFTNIKNDPLVAAAAKIIGSQLHEADSRIAKTPAAVKLLSGITKLDAKEFEDLLYGLEYMTQWNGQRDGDDDYIETALFLKKAAERFSKRPNK